MTTNQTLNAVVLRMLEDSARVHNSGDVDSCLTMNQEIVDYIENQNNISPDYCPHSTAMALECVADAYATTKSWKLARKTYSQALGIIKKHLDLLGLKSRNKEANEDAYHTNTTTMAAPARRISTSNTTTENDTSCTSSTAEASNPNSCSPAAATRTLSTSAAHGLSYLSPNCSPSRLFPRQIIYTAYNVLQKIAMACIHLKDYSSALDAHKLCLGIVRRATAPCLSLCPAVIREEGTRKFVTILKNMACIYFADGAPHNAINFYKHSLKLQRSMAKRDLLAEADITSTIGSVFRQLGLLDTAIDWHENAIKLRTKVFGDDHKDLSSDLIAIGHIHFRQRKLDLALAAFSECMFIHRPEPISSSEASLFSSILYKMGDICNQLEDIPNAKDCYMEAIDMARSAVASTTTIDAPNNSSGLLARSLYKLSLIHQIEGTVCKAIDCAEEAIELGILEEPTIDASACTILSFVMRLHHAWGNAAKVQIYADRISEIEKKNSEGRPKKRSKLFVAPAA